MELSEENLFCIARPVWFQGLEKEPNVSAGFRAVFTKLGKTKLVLAGATIYRVFLNGEFIHHGPARGPHGFYRVDELDLTDRLRDGDNLLTAEVVGYNSNSFAYLNQPSFLQAEVTSEGQVLAATGGEGFECLLLPERIQKVERYSFQRPFAEAYRLVPEFDAWRKKVDAEFAPASAVPVKDKALILRGISVPDYAVHFATACVDAGAVSYEEKSEADRSIFWWMSEERYQVLDALRPDAFELDLLKVYQSCSFSSDSAGDAATPFCMEAGRFRLLDFGLNDTGFLGAEFQCKAPVRLLFVFDELLTEGDIDLKRNKTLNMVYCEAAPGSYTFESIEPYTLRFCKVIVLDGDVSFSRVYLREYVNPDAGKGSFSCSDPALEVLFEAGRETFRQNAVDIYMDCPGRERAGWLCDSFFTGRVEPLLCGDSSVEQNFIENFSLPETFEHLPDGMLPMCYPSDHPTENFIPQWAMWLVLELEEYLGRTGDRHLVERMRSKVKGLLNFLNSYENEDGLLEKLPGWNFLEWSKANELTQDVNYPTNMLYARMLESAARLYDDPDAENKAQVVHETVRQQSFDGTFFVDNAVRDTDGALRQSGESTEVCQYYAFFCGTASPEHFSNLWEILLDNFGPGREENGDYSAVHPANAFIGYYLRMELLSHYEETARLLNEMKGYFIGMAERTGTLWEHCDERASCNHGFASHICVHLYRDILGVHSIDPMQKTVTVKMAADFPLEHCSGTIPVEGGTIPVEGETISVRWSRGEEKPEIHVPDGWTVI